MKTDYWQKLALIDCGPLMVNQYALHDFIPNKWFEWDKKRAEVMIVGQDWGPYVNLKKYIDDYENERQKNDFDYQKFLFKTFSSRTEKFLIKALQQAFLEKFGREMKADDWEPFFFTVAVFFTRTGTLFRGTKNFDAKKGMALTLPFLKVQIETIKPKVIVTLGEMALRQVLLALDQKVLYKNLTSKILEIKDKKYIEVKGITIIPNFHPAAHVNPKLIRERLAMVWDYC